MPATDLIARLVSEKAKIAALRVFHIDDLTQTQVAIEPSQVETWPSVFHHESKDPAVVAAAVEAVESLHPAPYAGKFETRWLLRFADAADHSLLDVYQESAEPYGYIDGRYVKYAGLELLHFLREHFGVHEKTLDKM